MNKALHTGKIYQECPLQISNAGFGFIIGGCAFSKKQYGKPEPDLLPIASDTVVGLINNPGQIVLEIMNPDNRSDEKINAINVGDVTRSNTFAGRSETLVRSLMNRVG